MDENLQWYVDAVENELAKLRDGKFTGNIGMQFNFKDGGIANMNLGLNKSLKKPTDSVMKYSDRR